jgi:hypothetical protein
MNSDNTYSSQSEKLEQKSYDSVSNKEYSAFSEPDNEKNLDNAKYDIGKPRRIIIKARLIND